MEDWKTTCVTKILRTFETLLMLHLRLSMFPVESPCKTSPCLHEGTCIAMATNYTCLCLKYFHGRNCKSKYHLLLIALMGSLDIAYICIVSNLTTHSGYTLTLIQPYSIYVCAQYTCQLTQNFQESLNVCAYHASIKEYWQISRMFVSNLQDSSNGVFRCCYERKRDETEQYARRAIPKFRISNTTRADVNAYK